MTVERCKGSRDLCPEEMTRFRLVEDAFRDSCLRWGYGEVKTPTLEYLHLFTSTGTLTPAMLGKVYSFLDWDGWSGERVVLRPDGTIPVARMYIDSLADKGLARLFYVTNVFVFEPTGKESREKWQCGAELIGGNSRLADIELIMLALEVLSRLGIKDVKLKISHAGVIRAILRKARLSAEDEIKVFDQVLEGNGEALGSLGAERPELSQILPVLSNLRGKSSGFLKNLRSLLDSSFPGAGSSLDDFISIITPLEDMGVGCQVDITSGRGFEYYTGIMFQVFSGEEKVGGGGRYDALIPLMGGTEKPASGFALYLEPLMALLGAGIPAVSEMPQIMINASPDRLKQALSIARSLRDAGFAALLQHSTLPQQGIRWVVDVKSNGFILNDRTTNKSIESGSVERILSTLRGGK